MTLNSILNACGECNAKYQQLLNTQKPRLTQDEIMDGMNTFNKNHNCIFNINYLSDIKIFYDIHLKSGQTIQRVEFDICKQNGHNIPTELQFTTFNEATKVRYNFTCNAEDIIAIGEHYMQTPTEEQTPEAGSQCPICNKGRIALALSAITCADMADEPYESSIYEGNNEIITLDEVITYSLHICDHCGHVHSIIKE